MNNREKEIFKNYNILESYLPEKVLISEDFTIKDIFLNKDKELSFKYLINKDKETLFVENGVVKENFLDIHNKKIVIEDIKNDKIQEIKQEILDLLNKSYKNIISNKEPILFFKEDDLYFVTTPSILEFRRLSTKFYEVLFLAVKKAIGTQFNDYNSLLFFINKHINIEKLNNSKIYEAKEMYIDEFKKTMEGIEYEIKN